MPSNETPLVDFSAFMKLPEERLLRVRWLTGFAADDVASVGFIDEAGNIHTVSVKDNIYAGKGVSDLVAKAIVAYRASGAEIYRRSLVPGASLP